MKFIDEAQIEVCAGNGGQGCRHFRREKHVPFGGPDGGNGGNGGSVVVVADHGKHTLLDFRYQPKWKAEDGKPGQGSLKDGKAGEDVWIRVPVGTQILEADSRKLVVDLTRDGQQEVLAVGGRGGKGNAFFKSATNRTPEYFQPGKRGTGGVFILSLKLVADVGLIGFPNAGKSTLIARISAARPKIADYPFTTLTPNLGVVRTASGNSFVVADIPGLIPGAHTGKGLGTAFLKHVERTRVLAHLIDPLQLDQDGNPLPAEAAFKTINSELEKFSDTLAAKLQVVVVTKIDAVSDTAMLDSTLKSLAAGGYQTLAISSVSGAGIDELIEILARELENERS